MSLKYEPASEPLRRNWFDLALIAGTAVTIGYLPTFRGSIQVMRLTNKLRGRST